MIICSYCKQERLANDAPCMACGAPASMATRTNELVSSWSQAPQTQWQQVSSFPFAQSMQPSSTLSPFPSPSSPYKEQQGSQQKASTALVPFSQQGTMGLQPVVHSTHAPTIPLISPQPEPEGMIYVAPMYTKPRPLIPRYRVISGLLSFLIVCLMVCAGAGYYAKTSGALAFATRVITGSNTPPSIHASNATLPDPPNKIEKGPAYNIIPSATTTAHLIQGTYIAVQTDKVFTPGEQFALTYSAMPPQKTQGKVLIKWYTNGVLFTTTSSGLLQGDTTTSGVVQITYPQPSEGMVELYWTDQKGNSQFAQRLYFVVRN